MHKIDASYLHRRAWLFIVLSGRFLLNGLEKKVKVKLFLGKCHDFVVEDEDAFLVEAEADEAVAALLPLLSPRERVKFDQMKDVYVAKATGGKANAGCYYFLVSRGAKEIKFESVAILSSDLSSRAESVATLPDVPIKSLDDIDSIDLASY
jgi:hypothetical protein